MAKFSSNRFVYTLHVIMYIQYHKPFDRENNNVPEPKHHHILHQFPHHHPRDNPIIHYVNVHK